MKKILATSLLTLSTTLQASDGLPDIESYNPHSSSSSSSSSPLPVVGQKHHRDFENGEAPSKRRKTESNSSVFNTPFQDGNSPLKTNFLQETTYVSNVRELERFNEKRKNGDYHSLEQDAQFLLNKILSHLKSHVYISDYQQEGYGQYIHMLFSILPPLESLNDSLSDDLFFTPVEMHRFTFFKTLLGYESNARNPITKAFSKHIVKHTYDPYYDEDESDKWRDLIARMNLQDRAKFFESITLSDDAVYQGLTDSRKNDAPRIIEMFSEFLYLNYKEYYGNESCSALIQHWLRFQKESKSGHMVRLNNEAPIIEGLLNDLNFDLELSMDLAGRFMNYYPEDKRYHILSYHLLNAICFHYDDERFNTSFQKLNIHMPENIILDDDFLERFNGDIGQPIRSSSSIDSSIFKPLESYIYYKNVPMLRNYIEQLPFLSLETISECMHIFETIPSDENYDQIIPMFTLLSEKLKTLDLDSDNEEQQKIINKIMKYSTEFHINSSTQDQSKTPDKILGNILNTVKGFEDYVYPYLLDEENQKPLRALPNMDEGWFDNLIDLVHTCAGKSIKG